EIGQTAHAVVSFKGQSGESEYNPKVSQTVWLSQPSGVTSHYWTEQMLSEVPMPTVCPFGTEETDMNQMANTVLATMTVVLFAEMHDREQAFERAFSYWASYCAAN
ncbi:glycosyl transferase, partial [Vibrio sp. 378]|nr:glycosyl transferase [Vibrio sp. 378]